MTSQGEQLANAATACIGAPFRLHGRDPRFGLDCVGLVFVCLLAIGRRPEFASGYGLRNASPEALLAYAQVNGLVAAQDTILPGDILLVRPGPAQQHLLIASSANSFIHAHAGLKRVVSMPGPLPWPVGSCWRLPPDK